MFENFMNLFKKTNKREALNASSKEAAKERLHLVLMQDRANVSADFLDLMREEIIEVIKKYIDIDESSMDVRLTNQTNEEGVQGAPALYANIPILNIKEPNKNQKSERENNEVKKGQKEEVSKDAVKSTEIKKTEEKNIDKSPQTDGEEKIINNTNTQQNNSSPQKKGFDKKKNKKNVGETSKK